MLVIAEMMGVSAEDCAIFTEWSDAQDQFNNPFRTPEQEQRGKWGQANLEAYFAKEAEARQSQGGSDLISALVAAEEGGEKLARRELVINCNLLMIAGNLTTTDLIGNGTLALLRHPDQLALFKAGDTALVRNAVEEMLRYEPPVLQAGRITLEPREIDGVPVEPGQVLTLSLPAAGRDPAANPDPDRFDITRPEPRHLAFGGGAHFCLGAPLARAEAQEALPLLFERLPSLRLDPDQPLRRKQTYAFNGFEAIWVVA